MHMKRVVDGLLGYGLITFYRLIDLWLTCDWIEIDLWPTRSKSTQINIWVIALVYIHVQCYYYYCIYGWLVSVGLLSSKKSFVTWWLINETTATYTEYLSISLYTYYCFLLSVHETIVKPSYMYLVTIGIILVYTCTTAYNLQSTIYNVPIIIIGLNQLQGW